MNELDSTGNVADAYDRWAESYDTDTNATRDLDAEIIRRAGLRTEGRNIVELGCGTGKNTEWLVAHAESVVAMDFSSGMLARARARVRSSGVLFVRQDVCEPWPLASGRADVVIGNLVLEHVADIEPVYREAARVLRPAGQLYLCELHPERQRLGRQAKFTDRDTGTTHRVAAFMHTISDYVNGGIEAGFTLRHLGEWTETGARPDAPPRLVSLLFERSPD